MATTDTFSSNSNYYLEIYTSVHNSSVSGNWTDVYYRVRAYKKGSFSGHWSTTNMGNTGWATSNTGGYRNLWNNSNLAYDFTNGSYVTFKTGVFRVNHNSDGTGRYYVDAGMTLVNLGSANVGTGWRTLPRLASEPPAPSPLELSTNSQTSLRYRFRNNGDGGSNILQWQIGYGRSSSGPTTYMNGDGDDIISGLLPFTRYYVWSRGRNAVGWGDWSARRDELTAAGAQVKLNGVWRAAIPYVKVAGVWKLAEPYVKVAGKWKKTR